MRGLIAFLTMLFVMLGSVDARACMNATMSETEAVKKLKEAEAALDQGDVLTARELADDVHGIYSWRAPAGPADPLVVRAARIEALTYVRDREASPDELSRAVDQLRSLTEPRTVRAIPGTEPESLPPTPDLLADFGEALERNGQSIEAWNVLAGLADKDLIGSAYAYAAFSRAAKAKGDTAGAALGQQRCETMAANPSMCRGEYPARPFLRGHANDFFGIGAIFLALAAVRLARKKQLWTSFRAPLFAPFVVALGAAAFAIVNVRFFWPAVFVLFPLLFFGLMQRAQWVKAVRRGKVAGLTLRLATPDDAAPTTLKLLTGPALPEVIEGSVSDLPAYRDSARPPILFRLQQNGVKFGHVFVAGVLFAILLGCAMVFMTLKRG